MSFMREISSIEERIRESESQISMNGNDGRLIRDGLEDSMADLSRFTANLLSHIQTCFDSLSSELAQTDAAETSNVFSVLAEMNEQQSFSLEISERIRIVTRDLNTLENTLGINQTADY
jgi:hypothetical protein